MGVGLDLAGRRHDGVDLPIDVSLTPVRLGDALYVAAFVRDARERRRAIDRLNAVNEITNRLLAGEQMREILPLVVQRARLLCNSDAAWIVMPTTTAKFEIVSVDGKGTDLLLGFTLSADTSRSAEVLRTGQPDVIADLSEASNVPPGVVDLDLGPGLYVPFVADQRRLGTLVLGRVHGQPSFQPIDVAFAKVFAGAAAAAIEMGSVRAEIDRLSIIAEDERIARDLHDTVIQELFALGMSLQAMGSSVTGSVGDRISAAVESLDDVIRQIRNTIFRLPGRSETSSGLREEMLRLVDRYNHERGVLPRISFLGPVDFAVPRLVSEHLLHVFGESLSNVSRHANASKIEAIVAVEGEWLSFSLIDDGVGIGDGPSAGNGLRNMSIRAENLGGTCTITRRTPTGTIVEWRVPLSPLGLTD
jgi:signal transduction histidine kinase